MMGRQQRQDKRLEEIDEHDQPTEPMSQVILAPYSSMTHGAGGPNGVSSINKKIVPMPQPDERPFPEQSIDPFPRAGSSNGSPVASVYPFLPPAPSVRSNGRPAGGASPYPAQPEKHDRPVRTTSTRPRRSPVPVLVGAFFVFVQMLLLVRVALLLIGQSGSDIWVGLIYAISSMFVLPVRLLMDKVQVPLITGTDLYNYLVVLLAILIYGLFSRLLVRFLKALLHSR